MVNSSRYLALTGLLIACTFTSVPALSQDKIGWGVGAGIGLSQIKDRDDFGNGNETFKGSGFGYDLDIEYRFFRNFAIGIDFFTLGTASDTFNSVNTEIDVGGLGYYGRLIYPITDRIEVFGRIGEVDYSANVTPGGSNGLFGDSAHEWGLGIDVAGGTRFAYRLQVRNFDGPRAESGALLTFGLYFWF